MLCVGDGACAIMKVANDTNGMFALHRHDITGFQNDNIAAVLLYFQAQERLLAYLHMAVAQLGAIQFETMSYKMT